MDYEIITVDSYNGKSGKEKAVEVFDTVTGKALAIVRRAPFESRYDWIERAFAAAGDKPGEGMGEADISALTAAMIAEVR